ncbi:hypothetical protein [Vibrio phage ST2-2pr]|nr:hypothetical protein [Vibrio phage ST2-2pr]
MIDLIPLVYNTSESEMLGWTNENALRRYRLAKAKLGIK